MNHELATALNKIIAQAAPATTEQSIEDAFAALLAGTIPQQAPRHPVRCPVTGGVYTFVATAEEAKTFTARLSA